MDGTFYDNGGAVFNVKHGDFGALGDTRSFAASLSGSTLTGSGAAFTSADVGRTVSVPGAGAGGRALVAAIASVGSATQATLSAPATANVTNKTATLGKNDRAAIEAAWNAAAAAGGGRCYLPQGRYLITPPAPVTLTTSITFDVDTVPSVHEYYLRGSGLAAFADAVTLVVSAAATAANNRVYRVQAVAVDGSYVRVDGPVVSATETVDLTGWEPALRLRGDAVSKERQPLLEGSGRGVTLEVALPAAAPRRHPAVVVENWQVFTGTTPDEWRVVDAHRGAGLHNLRISSTDRGIAGTGADAGKMDFYGTGLLVRSAWTAELLKNFQIAGFYVGMECRTFYNSNIDAGEVRDCNFGLIIPSPSNGNSFRNVMFQRLSPALTVEDDLDAGDFPGGQVGAAIYLVGGSLNAVVFESVKTELVPVTGIYIGGGTSQQLTFIGYRSESTLAPLYVPGPADTYRTGGCTFINPVFDCDALGGPAVMLDRVRNYTFINPLFYQRANRAVWAASEAYAVGDTVIPTAFNDFAYRATAAGTSAGTQPAWPTAVSGTVVDGGVTWEAFSIAPFYMTANATGNLVVNPLDGDDGINGDLIDQIVDLGLDNLVQEPVRHMVRAARTTDVSYANNASAAIAWTAAAPNQHGMWSSGAPTQVLIPRDGVYDVVAAIPWAGSAAGYRSVSIRVNGTDRAVVRDNAAGTDIMLQQCVMTRRLEKGDVIEVYLRQTSGGALMVPFQLNYAPEITVTRRL
jgi:hypothetical protein